MSLITSLQRVPADFIRDQGWTDIDLDSCLDDTKEIMTWTKHLQLYSWMQDRYKTYSGKKAVPMYMSVRLFEHDFERLISDEKTLAMNADYFKKILPKMDFNKYAYIYRTDENSVFNLV